MYLLKRRKGAGKEKHTLKTGKKNVRKQLRLSGKEYINAKGQKVDARSLKPHNCQKCRYKCGGIYQCQRSEGRRTVIKTP